MKIFSKNSTIKLYNTCKAINTFLGIPIVLVIYYMFAIPEKIVSLTPIYWFIECFLYVLYLIIVILELPFIVIFDILEKMLSKNIDTATQVAHNINAQNEQRIPCLLSAEEKEKIHSKTELSKGEIIEIKRNIIKNNRKSLGMPHSSSDINLTWYLNQYMSLDSYISPDNGWIIADGMLIGRDTEPLRK